MREGYDNNLNERLEQLFNEFPECSWLEEFKKINLRFHVKPMLKVVIDNRYVNLSYKMFLSEN